MVDLGVYYANIFTTLLGALDSVPEGSGSLLDHTIVRWITENSEPARTFTTTTSP